VRRPVKWTGDRSEAPDRCLYGRDHLTKAELAFDASNKITGLRVKTMPISAPICRFLLLGAD